MWFQRATRRSRNGKCNNQQSSAMVKRNMQERDDEAVEAGGSLLVELLDAADKALIFKGKKEGPVYNFLKENNDRRGKGWLALAFKESDDTKDPDHIKRIVGKDIEVLLRIFSFVIVLIIPFLFLC
jgi:hypothetical protein